MLRPKETEAITAYPSTSRLPTSAAPKWLGRSWVLLGLAFTDTVTVGLGFLIAYALRYETRFPIFFNPEDSVVERYGQYIVVLIPVWLIIFAVFRLYDLHILFGGLEEAAVRFHKIIQRELESY